MAVMNLLERVIDYDMIEDADRMWVAHKERNGLFEIDKRTHSTKQEIIFEKNDLFMGGFYNVAEKVANKIILVPRSASAICIYDLDVAEMTYIPLELMAQNCIEDYKFWRSVSYDNIVYLLGFGYPAIIRLDIVTMEVTYLTKWVDEVKKNNELVDMGYFVEYVVVGSIAWIPFVCASAILKLDMATSKITIVHIDASLMHQ